MRILIALGAVALLAYRQADAQRWRGRREAQPGAPRFGKWGWTGDWMTGGEISFQESPYDETWDSNWPINGGDDINMWCDCLSSLGYDVANTWYVVYGNLDYSFALEELDQQMTYHAQADPNAEQSMMADGFDDMNAIEECYTRCDPFCEAGNRERCEGVCRRWTWLMRKMTRFWLPCYGCQQVASSQSSGPLCKIELIGRGTDDVFLTRNLCQGGGCKDSAQCRVATDICDNYDGSMLGYFACFLKSRLPACFELKIYRCALGLEDEPRTEPTTTPPTEPTTTPPTEPTTTPPTEPTTTPPTEPTTTPPTEPTTTPPTEPTTAPPTEPTTAPRTTTHPPLPPTLNPNPPPPSGVNPNAPPPAF